MSLDKFDAENQRELSFPVLLIGEGKADVSFLMKLMERRGVANIHFGFPTAATGGFGLTGLGRFLSSLPLRSGFDKLRAVIVYYDNDTDAAEAFTGSKDSVDASDPYSVPDAPMVLARQDGDKTRIMFVPMPGPGLTGAIETLLLQSVPADAASECVDAFAACATIEAWPASHQAKMRLRSHIAARCRGNSDMTLTNIWGVQGNPIDLMHPCFDGVVQSVRDVAAAL